MLLALRLAGCLFVPFGADPLSAYAALLGDGFASLRGFGFTLVKASPLILVALGTIVSWQTGFLTLGFDGCYLAGAAASTAVALHAAGLPAPVFLPLALAAAFAAGAAWSGWVAALRVFYGGNEVLVSLMANYVAALAVQYLVSGPLRAPSDLPQSPRLPPSTWLPGVLPGTRAHAGILVAVAAAGLVAVLLRRTPLGFELNVTGLNPLAARYAGIRVGRSVLLAALVGGGLAGLAGLVDVLGLQHRLIDGMSGGTGFVGIVVALLARMDALTAVPVGLAYAGILVGAEVMQREAGLPASIVFILQSLIVLMVLASDVPRRCRLRTAPRRARTARERADESS